MNNEDLIKKTIENSIAVKHKLQKNSLVSIVRTAGILTEAVRNNKMIFFAGNGGSAADSQHLVAELVIRFRSGVNRRGIKAMSLSTDPSIMTAGGNDIGFDNVFAREIEALAGNEDVLVAISTSGNSQNIINAIGEARKCGAKIVGLLGCGGGKILSLCDASVVVDSDVTARIQESHIMIGHIWCDIVERELFADCF